MTDPMRVLVVDDHEEFRHSLEALLGAMDDVEVVGRAGDGRRAVELALDLQPDVVVMDLHMPRAQRRRGHRPDRRSPRRTSACWC